MKSKKNAGRLVGGLLLAQLVGMFVSFYFLAPGVTTDYLEIAAGMEGTIRMSVIVLFVNSALTLAMALVAFPAIREYSLRTAIVLLAFGVIWIVVQSIDNAHILSMLSLSQRYAESGGANADLYNLMGLNVRSTRIAIHFTELLVVDVWFTGLYGALFAFRLVPRPIGALALLGVALHLIGVPLPLFIGYPFMMNLAFGIIPGYVLIGGWLLAKGFPERNPTASISDV